MKPGVYADIPNADYHGGPGTSKSGLDIVRKSLLHFKYVKDAANDNERKPTEAQAFGSAFHTITLEPKEFVKSYCLGLRRSDVPEAIDERDTLVSMVGDLNATRLPKLSTSGSKDDMLARVEAATLEHAQRGLPGVEEFDNTKVGVAALKAMLVQLNEHRPGQLSTSGSRHDLANLLRANGHPVTLWSDVQAEWLTNNSERQVVGEEDWTHLHGMRDAVMAHPAAGKLLRMAGVAEQSFYWIDERTGMLLRCRPDYRTDSGIIVDLKSTDDASPEGFARSIAKWRYHVQHPFYVDGTNEAIRQAGIDMPKSRAFVFIAVEKKPPFAVGVYKLDGESVDIGRLEYREDVDKLAHAIETNEWPAYGDDIQPIALPTWKKSQAIAAL
ncbi:PD-(D/E)XK nuclease-like domain-containing protein [Bradyrhizobium sp. 613_E4_N2_2]|uniref:PD-(D/E)XK nuclease-like domain-containing protein n=1 Tax=Bradyrhizobium sp. 613_E4_N2_2 TaxID=3240371 RepID=UPI003F8CBBFC